MRPLLARTTLGLFVASVTFGAVALAGGCGMSGADLAPADPDGGIPADAASDTRVHPVEVGEDAGGTRELCGEEKRCDPDIAAICTPLEPDAGVPEDATDGSTDGEGDAEGEVDAAESDVGEGLDAGTDAAPPGTGSVSACRVTKRENRTIAACAPAGKVAESQFCANDDECAPGLACVGEPGLGRCLRYCCGAWSAPDLSPDAGGGTHYCTPKPLAARPSDKVPVWVKLDDCTLLEDELNCPEGTTCTVVTNDGRTTCVPAVPGQREWASCVDQGCDKGYVCLGTIDRRCRKLCRESDGSAGCSAGAYCQRVPTIPEGFGICSGGDAGP